MPVNNEGEEVNQDGSEITPEQQETSDWTQVIELNQKNIVKPLDIDVLAPNVVPHNIPYLEVYRTDEVYAKEYTSPYLNNTGNTSTDSTIGTENNQNEDADSSSGNSHNPNTSSNGKNGAEHSSKTKNEKLAKELETVLKNHYKSTTNFKVLVNRYMLCKTNKLSISVVNGRSANNLKKGTDVKSMTNAILRIKKKYS